MKRYRFDEIPITEKEAHESRRRQIEIIWKDIEESKREIDEILSSPLPTTMYQLVTVMPGEPGYETAEYSANTTYSPWMELVESARKP